MELVATVIDLTRPARYVHWGWIQISLSNVLVIAAMIAVLVLAIALPFPRGRS